MRTESSPRWPRTRTCSPRLSTRSSRWVSTGKDLAVNTTALAWLVTVREVNHLWGRKAARQALALFIYVAVTVAGAAWMLNHGKTASEATFIAAALPLTVLVSVWNRLGGE